MKSIRDVYKIGKGPSSSHTMGPEFASRIFRDENPEADSFKAVLYGSLAKTGMGKVFLIFIEGGGTDGAQVTPCQCRLEDVRRVHGTA